MSKSRSNNILFIGVAVFAVGALLAFVGFRGRDKAVARSGPPPAAAAKQETNVRTVTAGPVGTAVTTFTIPEGMQAVAVDMPAVQGLAGYAKAGDLVNVYATVRNAQPEFKLRQPIAKLVLTAVKVLDVRSPAAGGTGNATYLLALTVDQAEQLIFFAKFEAIWLALANPDQKPVSSVGRSYQNAL